MDLVMYSLTTVAKAIVEPIYLLMLIVLGVIFYFKNKRISMIQRMTIGEYLDTPLELTLSQIVIGIIAGAFTSVILTLLGITFNANSAIGFIFFASIIMMFLNQKNMCFSYSGTILAVIGLLIDIISKITGKTSLLDINILSLLTLVGVLHITEGILVMMDGSRGAIPVFTNKDDKIIGGFSLNRYWVIPVAILFILGNEEGASPLISVTMPQWWPIIKDTKLLSLLSVLTLSSMPFYGVIGYNAVTFTRKKKVKALLSGICTLIYGISLVAVAQLSNIGFIGEVIAVIYMPMAHKIMMKVQSFMEKNRRYLYVSDEEGISILEVAPSSIAFQLGIRRGDKILAVNGQDVLSEIDVIKAIKENVYGIPIKIKNKAGEVVEYFVQPKNKRLGMLLVPRMVKNESKIDISSDEFKRILDEFKKMK